ARVGVAEPRRQLVLGAVPPGARLIAPALARVGRVAVGLVVAAVDALLLRLERPVVGRQVVVAAAGGGGATLAAVAAAAGRDRAGVAERAVAGVVVLRPIARLTRAVFAIAVVVLGAPVL